MKKLLWSKKRPKYSRSDKEWHSISSKLRSESKTSDEFEVMLSRLTLEELIALKIEISARATNHKLYGFDIWKKAPRIARDAVLKYAYTGTRTTSEMASFLGITKESLKEILSKYKPQDFFKKDE